MSSHHRHGFVVPKFPLPQSAQVAAKKGYILLHTSDRCRSGNKIESRALATVVGAKHWASFAKNDALSRLPTQVC